MRNFEEVEEESISNLMDIENSENHDYINNYFLNNNNLIYFGFFEKSSNIFYKVEESRSIKFEINKFQKL